MSAFLAVGGGGKESRLKRVKSRKDPGEEKGAEGGGEGRGRCR